MATDTMRLEAPAAKVELELLRGMKVGDKRESPLLPALDADMAWTCTVAEEDRWEFEGTFFGQVVFRVVIQVQPEYLVLDVLEGAA